MTEHLKCRQKAVGRAKLIVVKVGTRLLTDPDNIPRIIEQIAWLRERGKQVILVSSGAVGLGMTQLGLKRRPPQLAAKQALASIGQSELMRRYADAAALHKFAVAQLLLTAHDLRNRKSHLNIMACLEELLHRGVLPIINENDSVATRELRVGDNDTLSALIAAMVRADLAVILTTVDGLWRKEGNKLVDRISTVRELSAEVLGFAGGSDDTALSIGGMQTKLESASRLMEAGDYLWIVDGREPWILKRVLDGDDVGTLFVPAVKKMAAKKRWIRFFTPVRGRLVVNAGAAEALRHRGGSLLSAGLLAVQGNFAVGDAVEVVDPNFARLAIGLVQHGITECASMCGFADDVETAKKELICRDDLVLC